MVLINDKKYACGTCIKGHRVSGCTHTDRPLFEVKKKGRPTTQCVHCRDNRKTSGAGANGGTIHTKCACGEPKPIKVLMPGSTTPILSNEPYPSQHREGSPPSSRCSISEAVETRKGQPGSTPTFPNGLKDVHDMAAAAEALSGLGDEPDPMRVAERRVASLLNPCLCTTGGEQCKCCQPKTKRRESLVVPSSSSSGSRTPTNVHGNVTDSLIEMFKSKATTNSTPSDSSSSAHPQLHVDTTSSSGPTWAQLMNPHEPYLSPGNLRHPAHTSPHVHKTKLYSPYSLSGHSSPRHGRRENPSPSGPRPSGPPSGWGRPSIVSPPSKLRPLADMNKFLGAVFREDGSVNEEIPRSALGLPGIQTFDTMAESGGVKIEPMEIDVDGPIQFPTHEDVVIGACTCGEDCECAGCATHDNAPSTGEEGHVHHSGCGDNCKSSFDCGNHLSLPSGITSIEHLLSIAAANVPPPVRVRPGDLNAHAHDTRIFPPAVHVSEDAARSCGVMTLKALECCNGRCQCAPGQCTCEKECCGCCIRCACAEDGDQKMYQEPAKGCCSTTAEIQPQPQPSQQGSCCSADNQSSNQSSPRKSVTPPHLSPRPAVSTRVGRASPLLLSPDSALTISRQPSPHPPGHLHTQPVSLRRSSSTSLHRPSASTSSARRATMTHGSNIQRSASSGKQASKALALHTTPNHPHSHSHPHPHPRPILPKPPSGPQQGTLANGSGGGSGTLTPNHNSAENSKQPSPIIGPQLNFLPQSHQPFQLPDASPALPTVPDISISQDTQEFTPNLGSENAFPDLSSDDDIMAFINSLSTSIDPGLSYQVASSESSMEQPLATPDLSFDHNGPFNQPDAMSQGFDPDFLDMLNNAMDLSQSTQEHESTLPMPPSQTQDQVSRSLPSLSSSGTSHQPAASGEGEMAPQPQNGLHQNLYNLFGAPGNPQSEMAPGPVYHQLPLQSTAFLQQMFAQNPLFAHSTPDGQNRNSSSDQAGKADPNLIDLSKPLNSGDVERILKALQEQQVRQSPSSSSPRNQGTQAQTPSQPQNLAPGIPPQYPLHNGHTFAYNNNDALVNIAPSGAPVASYAGQESDYLMNFVISDDSPSNGMSHANLVTDGGTTNGTVAAQGYSQSNMGSFRQGGPAQHQLFLRTAKDGMGF